MARAPAPVSVTGGAGFGYEDEVAAYFLAHFLAGRPPLDPGLGTVLAVDFQVRESGWLLDDLLVTCQPGDGSERRLAISAKRRRQVTRKGFPDQFVRDVWEQWLCTISSVFVRGRDLLGLATGELADPVESAWGELLTQARATSPGRLQSRLQSEGQCSAVQQGLYNSLHCPQDLAKQARLDPAAADPAEILPHVRLLHLDFRSPSSRDRAEAIQLCQGRLVTGSLADATKLWSDLVAFAAGMRQVGGTIDAAVLLTRCSGYGLLRGRQNEGRGPSAGDPAADDDATVVAAVLTKLTTTAREAGRLQKEKEMLEAQMLQGAASGSPADSTTEGARARLRTLEDEVSVDGPREQAPRQSPGDLGVPSRGFSGTRAAAGSLHSQIADVAGTDDRAALLCKQVDGIRERAEQELELFDYREAYGFCEELRDVLRAGEAGLPQSKLNEMRLFLAKTELVMAEHLAACTREEHLARADALLADVVHPDGENEVEFLRLQACRKSITEGADRALECLPESDAPAVLRTRLALLLQQMRIVDAAALVRDRLPHRSWCDLAVAVLVLNGEEDVAGDIRFWAEGQEDLVVRRRCLLRYAEGLFGRVRRGREAGSALLPGGLSSEETGTLARMLEMLAPITQVVLANKRVGSELELVAAQLALQGQFLLRGERDDQTSPARASRTPVILGRLG